jgi:hypothetical protein
VGVGSSLDLMSRPAERMRGPFWVWLDRRLAVHPASQRDDG